MNIHRSYVLTALAWLVPRETAVVSAHVLCTPYNHAPCHFMQSHIYQGDCAVNMHGFVRGSCYALYIKFHSFVIFILNPALHGGGVLEGWGGGGEGGAGGGRREMLDFKGKPNEGSITSHRWK